MAGHFEVCIVCRKAPKVRGTGGVCGRCYTFYGSGAR